MTLRYPSGIDIFQLIEKKPKLNKFYDYEDKLFINHLIAPTIDLIESYSLSIPVPQKEDKKIILKTGRACTKSTFIFDNKCQSQNIAKIETLSENKDKWFKRIIHQWRIPFKHLQILDSLPPYPLL